MLIIQEILFPLFLTLLYAWNPAVTLANSEDPDEMPQNAAFHQGLHCFAETKQLSRTEVYILIYEIQRVKELEKDKNFQ